MQVLHRLGQHVRGVVADHLQRVVVAAGDEAEFGIAVDQVVEVAQHAVQPHRQRRAGQARPDRDRHRRAGDRAVVAANGFRQAG